MRNALLAGILLHGLALGPMALAQPSPSWPGAHQPRSIPTYRPDAVGSASQPLLQLDVTGLLEAPPPPTEPPPQQKPMFSNGWTRDGFGGQPRGWR